MGRLGYERYCTEVVAEAARFADTVREADPARRVPTCPDWTLQQLTAHIGQAHRWVATIVDRRSTEPVHLPDIADLAMPGSGADRAGWLLDGAHALSAALREAGEDTRVWTWAVEQHTGFWARRMVHETVVHRVDAELATGGGNEIAPDLAADGVSEWLDILSLPTVPPDAPDLMDLLREGPTLHFHATDGDLGAAGEWMVGGGPSGVVWEHGHGKGDVALRGPAADLLLVLARRLPVEESRAQVLGDATLLSRWLQHTSF
ncbi:MAG: maleylpyruvate isomerase family mycothiol-dependent enzyme [Pseudonocardiaceae bacterium]|nr:maleylpyruvate isomerase family mycothiol-dependent enzyme [Pseudonocardiaceae bacterium]